jgi:hypothetical protein
MKTNDVCVFTVTDGMEGLSKEWQAKLGKKAIIGKKHGDGLWWAQIEGDEQPYLFYENQLQPVLKGHHLTDMFKRDK